MTRVRATNGFSGGPLSSAYRPFIASNLKVALVDLTRSPGRPPSWWRSSDHLSALDAPTVGVAVGTANAGRPRTDPGGRC